MRLEYQLTREDYRDFLGARSRSWGEFSLGWLLPSTIFIGAGFGLVESIYGFEINQYVFIILLFVLLFAIGMIGSRVNRAVQLRRWKAPSGPTIIEIDENWLRRREEGIDRAYAWENVGMLAHIGTHIEMQGKLEDEVFFIPLRAFPDREAMRDFYLTCESHWSRHDPDEADADDEDENAMPEAEDALPAQARSVTCRIEPADWAAVNADLGQGKIRLSFVQSALLTLMIGGLISGGIGTLIASLLGYPFEPLVFAASAFPGALIAALLAARAYDKAQSQLLGTIPAPNRAFTLTIDGNGLTRKSDGLDVCYAWKVIRRIELQGQSILFGMAWNEHVIAPKHAFADEQDYSLFLQEASRWQKAAKPAAGSAT